MRIVLALFLVALFALSPLVAQQRSEFEVKAAYLYNFARFVEWPSQGSGPEPFSICVLGADPFGQALDATLAGVTLRGGKVVARRLGDAKSATDCQILFISASEERLVAMILALVGTSDVLTVSDMPRFVQRGGMVQFVSEGQRIRFEVGLEPARAAGLMFSSELLRVASAVRGNPR